MRTGLFLVLAIPGLAHAACEQSLSPGDDLQAAIDGAAVGTEICLAPGTYTGSYTVVPGSSDPDLTIRREPSASGDVVLTDPTGDTLLAVGDDTNITTVRLFDLVIDDAGRRGIYLSSFAEAQLTDVVIRNIDDTDGDGAGVMGEALSKLTVERCEFRDLHTSGEGGAIFSWADTVVDIRDSLFVDNSAQAGGAIYVHKIALYIEGSRFQGNAADETGGAIRLGRTETVEIDSSEFVGNSADGNGGGIGQFGGGDMDVTASLFCGNHTAGKGGAIHADSDGGVRTDVSGSVFAENSALQGGAVAWADHRGSWHNNTFAANGPLHSTLWFDTPTTFSISNNAFYGNLGATAEIWATLHTEEFRLYPSYNGSFGGAAPFIGGDGITDPGNNRTDDPLFVDFTADGNCDNDDYHLASGSPYIDAGDPDVFDLDGTRSDIGAYGGSTPFGGPPDVDGDGADMFEDCDDDDATRFPGNDETCNGVDDDCDFTVDEDAIDASEWYADADADGFGTGEAVLGCDAPAGHASQAADCNDGNPGVYPGAMEACNGLDDDCDPATESGEGELDADEDGYTACGGDCDDEDPEAYPGAVEIEGDGVDQSCSGFDASTDPIGGAAPSCSCRSGGSGAGWLAFGLALLGVRRRER